MRRIRETVDTALLRMKKRQTRVISQALYFISFSLSLFSSFTHPNECLGPLSGAQKSSFDRDARISYGSVRPKISLLQTASGRTTTIPVQSGAKLHNYIQYQQMGGYINNQLTLRKLAKFWFQIHLMAGIEICTVCEHLYGGEIFSEKVQTV